MFIHNPHESSFSAAGGGGGSLGSSVRFLNINREVTALAAGPLASHLSRDILVIGTNNSMQAYDVMDNRDLFFRDVPDAATAAAFGSFPVTAGGLPVPIAFAGGNCSIQVRYAFGLRPIALIMPYTCLLGLYPLPHRKLLLLRRFLSPFTLLPIIAGV